MSPLTRWVLLGLAVVMFVGWVWAMVQLASGGLLP